VTFSPGNLYSDLDGATLQLRKKVPPVPEGVAAAERPLPYVTRLSPKETFSEEFLLPIPIRLSPAFAGRAPAAPSRPATVAETTSQAERVVYSLGVFRSDSGIRFLPVPESQPGVFRVWPPGPCADRQVVLKQTATLDKPIPVLAIS
jgi:hypothetical protein